MARILSVIAVLLLGAVGFRLGFGPSGEESPDLPEQLPETESTPIEGEAVPRRSDSGRDLLLLRIAESDTYLPAMIAESDSVLRRWPERQADPLRVFMEPSNVPGYSSDKDRSVRDAFRRWERVPEIPVDFVYIDSPEEADVTVKWIESFSMERAGQAHVVWQGNGLIREGTLTLATHTPDGYPFSTDAVFTVALHEIGHLLGLGHSDEPGDVMYPTTGVHDLTRRDRQTAMFLYSLPPGRTWAR